MIFKKYKAQRIDCGEKGDVLVIDYKEKCGKPTPSGVGWIA